jgi:hypothetical protein
MVFGGTHILRAIAGCVKWVKPHLPGVRILEER